MFFLVGWFVGLFAVLEIELRAFVLNYILSPCLYFDTVSLKFLSPPG